MLSLEQCKKLKEWVFPQQGAGNYYLVRKMNGTYFLEYFDDYTHNREPEIFSEIYKCPNLGELIEWIISNDVMGFSLTHGTIGTHEFGNEYGFMAYCLDCTDTGYGYNPTEAVYNLCEAIYKDKENQ